MEGSGAKPQETIDHKREHLVAFTIRDSPVGKYKLAVAPPFQRTVFIHPGHLEGCL